MQLKKEKLAELKEEEETARRVYEIEKSEGLDSSQSLAEIEELQTKIQELEFDLRRLDLLSNEKSGETVSEAQKYDFGLDASVRVWSDFCKVNVHPNSVCLLDSFDHEFDAFDIWSQGATALSSQLLEEYMDTNLRRWAEETDHLKGFHIFVDATLAWGRVADSFLDDIRQEYGKKSIFTFADVQQPLPPASKEIMEKNFSLAANYRDTVERSLLNTSFSMQTLRSKSDAFVPYSYSHLGDRFSHLSRLDPKNRFHTSALIASAIENSTLHYRFTDTPNSMSSILSTLSPVSSLNTSTLSLAAPLPLRFEKDLLMDLLRKEDPLHRASFMTPLLDGLTSAESAPHKTPFSELACLRGVPDWARKPAGASSAENAPPSILLMMQYMSAYQCRHRS